MKKLVQKYKGTACRRIQSLLNAKLYAPKMVAGEGQEWLHLHTLLSPVYNELGAILDTM